jgi:pyrimidine operon attenuation protein/uracil phosphoribosyltransferase
LCGARRIFERCLICLPAGIECLTFLLVRNTYDQIDVGQMLGRLIDGIADEFAPKLAINIVGIRTRGETIAGRIARALTQRGYARVGFGVLDVTLYRDDLSQKGPRPLVLPTRLELQLDDNPCVLVDDVLFTGRSVRAALGLLHDFGRPKVVRLAVLVDRNGRELPIHPDYAGLTLQNVPRDYRVNVKLAETDGADEVVVEPRH